MNPLTYAKLAQKVYSVPPQIGTADSSCRAIVEMTDDGVALVFRGSDDTASWLADLDAETVNVHGLGELHNGFYQAWKLNKDMLLNNAADVVCGHSLGAALAILHGAIMCLNGKPPKAVFAFEPPRVSVDDMLANLFSAHGVQLFLYRNGADIVTDVPVTLPTLNWQHPAPLIHIGVASLPIPNVQDHMIESVIEAVKAWVSTHKI